MIGKPRAIVVNSGDASPLDFTSPSTGDALEQAPTIEGIVESAAITDNDSDPV